MVHGPEREKGHKGHEEDTKGTNHRKMRKPCREQRYMETVHGPSSMVHGPEREKGHKGHEEDRKCTNYGNMHHP